MAYCRFSGKMPNFASSKCDEIPKVGWPRHKLKTVRGRQIATAQCNSITAFQTEETNEMLIPTSFAYIAYVRACVWVRWCELAPFWRAKIYEYNLRHIIKYDCMYRSACRVDEHCVQVFAEICICNCSLQNAVHGNSHTHTELVRAEHRIYSKNTPMPHIDVVVFPIISTHTMNFSLFLSQ